MNKSSPASNKVLMNPSALISSSRSSSSCCAPMGSCGAGTTTTGVVLGVVPAHHQTHLVLRPKAYLAETIIEDCRLVLIVFGGLNGRFNSLVARNHERDLNPMHVRCHRPIVHDSILWLKDFTFGNILQLALHDL